VPRELSAEFILEKNRLEQGANRWLQLWQVQISEGATLYLTNQPRPVVYETATYVQYPIRHDVIREEATGRLQRIVVHVANVTREVQYYLEHFDGLRGRRVALILILLDPDDDPVGELRQRYTIDSVTANEQVASFTLGKTVPWTEIRLPLRMITRDLFPAVRYA
jgi:phage-related protein